MILITGSSGQVGGILVDLLDKKGIEYVAPNRSNFPLEDIDRIKSFLSKQTFTTIIHLAAETNVDFCETNRELALLRNCDSVKALVEYCLQTECKLIFVSSSAVLSGDEIFMHEEKSNYAPANFYGVTKMEAEKLIVGSGVKYLIIRASWMLGVGNGVKKYAQVIYDRINNGEKVQGVFDRFGSLTSSFRLAKNIIGLLEFGHSAIIHCASITPCSRYDIAKHIALRLGKTNCVEPVTNDYFKLMAPRGFSEGLSSNAQNLLPIPNLTWEDELDNFLKDAYQ